MGKKEKKEKICRAFENEKCLFKKMFYFLRCHAI
jgi:hypothetical protein